MRRKSGNSGPVIHRITGVGVSGLDRRIALTIAVFVLVLSGGTIGFVTIEGWNWFDSFYMTVITVTTVGFAETHPLSTGGRAFAIVVMLGGVATLLYSVGLLSEYVVSGHLRGLLGIRKMEREIQGLSGHYIVCGFGRTGRTAADQIAFGGHRVVIVDRSEDAIADAVERGFPAILGDAGSDGVLQHAGVGRAAGLVASTAPDAQTILVVLSARVLNPDLNIVARAESSELQTKLRTAGANRVVSLYEIAGHRIAHMVARPEVTDFFDILLHDREVELEIEEIQVGPNSAFAESTISEARRMERSGANIVAIRKSGSAMTALVSPGTHVSEGDVLIALGTRSQLQALKSAAG